MPVIRETKVCSSGRQMQRRLTTKLVWLLIVNDLSSRFCVTARHESHGRKEGASPKNADDEQEKVVDFAL